MNADVGHGPLDGRLGNGHPHGADHLTILTHRHSRVAQRLAERLTIADGLARPAGQGFDHLWPVIVIVHPRWRIDAVADHLAVGQDDRKPQVGFFAQLLAQSVHLDLGIVLGGEQRAKLRLGQPCPRSQVVGCPVEVNPLQPQAA